MEISASPRAGAAMIAAQDDAVTARGEGSENILEHSNVRIFLDSLSGGDSASSLIATLQRIIAALRSDGSSESMAPSQEMPADSHFKDFMRDLVGPDGKQSISEQKLQYGIISYQIYQKSPSLQQDYRNFYEAARDSGKSIKEAARSALTQMSESGKLADWEVDWVYSLSHRAAQLDNSHAGLNHASSEEIGFDAALHRAELALVGIQGGSIEVAERGPLGVGWLVQSDTERSEDTDTTA